ncbi:branched-chain alpha-keto acid dehydrogenase subunit E2 [compost metagenome]
MIEDDGGRHTLERLAAAFRENVLDYSRDVLELRSQMPWNEIADFVRGDNEAVLSLLADDSADTRAGWTMVVTDDSEVRPESKVLEVRARVGQRVNVGDILVVSETDKVTIEHSAKQTGIVKRVYVEVGAGLVAGQPIVALSLDGRIA